MMQTYSLPKVHYNVDIINGKICLFFFIRYHHVYLFTLFSLDQLYCALGWYICFDLLILQPCKYKWFCYTFLWHKQGKKLWTWQWCTLGIQKVCFYLLTEHLLNEDQQERFDYRQLHKYKQAGIYSMPYCHYLLNDIQMKHATKPKH